jgi:hypothetical protein
VSDDIDWSDLCDIGARFRQQDPDSRDVDWLGQGLTAREIRTMATVDVTGEWL